MEMISKEVGEKLGGEYAQNILYIRMKFSNN